MMEATNLDRTGHTRSIAQHGQRTVDEEYMNDIDAYTVRRQPWKKLGALRSAAPKRCAISIVAVRFEGDNVRDREEFDGTGHPG